MFSSPDQCHQLPKVKMNDLNHIRAVLAGNPSAGEQGIQAPKNALPVRAFAWVGRIFLMMMIMMMLTGQAFADTTFVSGAVSGEWTRDGNPYIVVDSTWVPEGERLMLTAGVDAFFNEGQGLYVFGTMNAEGRENDSVRIRVSEGVEHWKGIRFYETNQAAINYTSLISIDCAIYLDRGCTLVLDNSLIDAENPLLGNSSYEVQSGFLTINNSTIRNRNVNESAQTLSGGRFHASGSRFEFLGSEEDENYMSGFSGQGTQFVFTNCVVIGRLGNEGGVAYVDSCSFLKPPHGTQRTGVSIGPGRITESHIEGSLYAGQRHSQITRYVRNNIIEGTAYLHGSVNVFGCQIGNTEGNLQIDECENITIRNSVVYGVARIDRTNEMLIDSCYLGGLGASVISRLQVSHCVIDQIGVGGSDSIFVFNNTIIEYDTMLQFGGSIPNIGAWRNNVIINPYGGGMLFDTPYRPDNAPRNFKYNCVWGFDFSGYDVSQANDIYYPIEDIDSTNIIAEPILRWEEMVAYLQENSPCIDAGDHDFPLDPDGTRSDIGSRYFHQINAVPVDLPSPSDFQLSAFPNPFNSLTTISFGLDKSAPTRLAIYDINGREVANLLAEDPPFNSPPASKGGKHSVVWEATDVPAGVYICRVETPGASLGSIKLFLMK